MIQAVVTPSASSGGSLVANPLFGAVSDRTTSRLGRRAPWIAGGFAGAAVAIGVLAAAPTITMMIIGWCAVQTLLNASYAALSASVPDQVPTRQRGMAAGYIGLALILGVAIGTGLAVLGGGTTLGYLACALFMLASAVPFLQLRRDAPGHALAIGSELAELLGEAGRPLPVGTKIVVQHR